MKYSDLMVEWLAELGYTHCFFVAGGNIMHLLDGVRKRMHCVPFVHEVGAGIAVEYFNASDGEGRALALVTAGPGLTNIVTALAGAYLESRELLLLGGQVKGADLARGDVRQRGIQEVDGVAIADPLCVATARFEEPVPRSQFVSLVQRGSTPRRGPVFLEVCLDAQGTPVDREALENDLPADTALPRASRSAKSAVTKHMREAMRPVWLIGGGVDRETATAVTPRLRELGVPVMTTWNGADRFGANEPFYFGRPNTWGQRYANVLIQQADLIVAFGTRLGMQQTGFNWQEFGRQAKLVQVDVDPAELHKGHPHVDMAIEADANSLLNHLAGIDYPDYDDWLTHCRKVQTLLPLVEESNVTASGYLCPYRFTVDLSAACDENDVVVPCSSGGGFTVPMQAFMQKSGQVIVTSKGLASMGYGLSGAIGAALGHPDRRVILIEGDGGLMQNAQELATIAVNKLNVKTFVFSNEGYASIRMTQRNYFDGQYLGCDIRSGLGFPDWLALFQAYGIPAMTVSGDLWSDAQFRELFEAPGPAAFVVPMDPEQTYFPKISSRVTADGSMESNPLDIMAPDLPDELAREVFIFG